MSTQISTTRSDVLLTDYPLILSRTDDMLYQTETCYLLWRYALVRTTTSSWKRTKQVSRKLNRIDGLYILW